MLRAVRVGMLREADRNSLPVMKWEGAEGGGSVEIRRRFVFEEVVENADDKVLARLKFVDRSGFVGLRRPSFRRIELDAYARKLAAGSTGIRSTK